MSKQQELSSARQVGYGSGCLGKSLIWQSMDLLLFFFLTEYAEISPLQAGVIILVSLIASGIADPVMGILTDYLKVRFNIYSELMLVGAPITGLLFAHVFLSPYLYDDHLTFIIMINCIFLRVIFSAIDVPHNAMFYSLSSSENVRVNIAGYRTFFGSLGGVSASVLIALVVFEDIFNVEESRFLLFGAIAFFICCFSIFVCFRAVRSCYTTTRESISKGGVKNLIVTICNYRPLLVVFAWTIVGHVFVTAFVKGLPYYAKYVLGDEQKAGSLQMSYAVAAAISAFLWVRIAKKYSVEKLSLNINVLIASVFLGAMIAIFAHPRLIFFLAPVAGVCICGLFMMIWTNVPIVLSGMDVSEGSQKYEGTVFGVFTAVNKMSIGIGAIIFGYLLQPDASPLINLINLRYDYTVISVILGMPVLGGALASILLIKFKKTHMQK
ncbi:MFS transporter [Porticoccus sp. GXU_MW_L64]